MTREEKCIKAIELGYTYDPETGKIFGVKGGNEIIGKDKDGYIIICNSRFRLRGHIFAWYYMYQECIEEIDHIDTTNPDNRSDNRKCNLRNANGHNQWNRNAKGYYWNIKTKKWRAQIRLNNKTIYLYYGDVEQDARQAYLEGKIKYHQF